jgi:peptidoglycan/xylan/chitin deacetylase (PgdA/CDA1 family)
MTNHLPMLKVIIDRTDSVLSNLSLRLLGEKNGLSSFLFHSVNLNSKCSKALYPQEQLTVNSFDNFIAKLLDLHYSFITPDDIAKGLSNPHKKYALLTFDDGYYNNVWILKVLEKYQVPAVFFISTSLILQNEKNWADIIYYERHKRGISDSTIHREVVALSAERIAKIRNYITKEFGLNSFIPQGDHDRMMTSHELAKFSKNKFVHIGNHSHNHEALASLSENECIDELTNSQRALNDIIGYSPNFISYPYGSFNERVINVAKNLGFSLGITTIQKKNTIPISSQHLMELNRFNPVFRNDQVNFDLFRSPIHMKTFLKQVLQ